LFFFVDVLAETCLPISFNFAFIAHQNSCDSPATTLAHFFCRVLKIETSAVNQKSLKQCGSLRSIYAAPRKAFLGLFLFAVEWQEVWA
jgi:hypothetical protein